MSFRIDTLRVAADRYLADCFARERPPQANELAARLGIPVYRLTRWFLRELGTTPSAYLKRAQIARAEMLLQTELPIIEVAHRSGFATPATFLRTFRRIAGVTPGTFRRRWRKTQP